MLYIIVPEIILGVFYGVYAIFAAFNDPNFATLANDFGFIYTNPIGIAVNVMGWALTGLTIYLIIIWSRQHNRQFDQPTTQSEPTT